jgi:hypothetical protein
LWKWNSSSQEQNNMVDVVCIMDCRYKLCFPNLLKTLNLQRSKNKFSYCVRFEVLTVASMKTAVFWVDALMIKAASTSEMSVTFYQTTWHNNPEDSHLQVFLYTFHYMSILHI